MTIFRAHYLGQEVIITHKTDSDFRQYGRLNRTDQASNLGVEVQIGSNFKVIFFCPTTGHEIDGDLRISAFSSR